MKKLLTLSLVGLVLILAGCFINKPITNQDLNDQNENINIPLVNNNQNVNINQNTDTNQLIDPTTGWKTYVNNKYGYEIKYPDNWIFNDDSNYDPIVKFCGPEYKTKEDCGWAGAHATPAISLRNDIPDRTDSNFCINRPNDIMCQKNLILSKSDINIDGRVGTIIEFKDMDNGSIYANWKLNSQDEKMFELEVIGLKTASNYRNIFNQMLSTFKFTK